MIYVIRTKRTKSSAWALGVFSTEEFPNASKVVEAIKRKYAPFAVEILHTSTAVTALDAFLPGLKDSRFTILDVGGLTKAERDTLAADVGAVVEEAYPLDRAEGAPSEAFPAAERTLLSRIGGAVNLPHYVASIMRRAATQ